MANDRHLWPVSSPEPGPQAPTPTTLRDVMSKFATGITVLTAAGEHCHGMTANAFSSVSLDPPMVLCCIARTAQMHEAILRSRHFGVSVLSGDQERVARYFASRDRPLGIAQFEGIEWFPGRRSGAPLISGSLAWLECELAEVYHGGDHSIFLGTVLEAFQRPGEALLFFGGGFHQGLPSPRSA